MPTTLREFQRLWRARRLLFLAAGATFDALPKAEEEALCAQALALLDLPDVPPWFLSVAFEMVRSPRSAFGGVYDPPETHAVHAAARAFVASLVSSFAEGEALLSTSPLAHAVRRSALLYASPSAGFRQRLDAYVVCLEAWCLAEAFPNALLRTARTLRFAATWWARRHATYRY